MDRMYLMEQLRLANIDQLNTEACLAEVTAERDRLLAELADARKELCFAEATAATELVGRLEDRILERVLNHLDEVIICDLCGGVMREHGLLTLRMAPDEPILHDVCEECFEMTVGPSAMSGAWDKVAVLIRERGDRGVTPTT